MTRRVPSPWRLMDSCYPTVRNQRSNASLQCNPTDSTFQVSLSLPTVNSPMSRTRESTKDSAVTTSQSLLPCECAAYFRGKKSVRSAYTGRRYRFNVQEDGTWDNRKTFAFVDSGVPDGKLVASLSLHVETSAFAHKRQVFTATLRDTCTQAVGMVSTSGTPLAHSLGKFTWARRLQTSSLPAMVAW